MKNFFKKLFCSNSMSKHFSETVQRIGKNNAGFSLVELIVVIAIMAILAAVAVIGLSAYIPKAQKAADDDLLNNINYIFNAACLDNGFGTDAVTNAVWDMENMTLESVQVNGQNNTDVVDSFIVLFDVKNPEFKVITRVVFDAGLHKFVDLDSVNNLTLSYGGGVIQLNPEDIEALKNSTFGEMGMGSLMEQLDSVTDLAGKLNSSALNNVLSSQGFINSATSALGIDTTGKTPAEIQSAINGKKNELAIEALKRQGNTNPTAEEIVAAEKKVMANATVLYTAQVTANMTKDEVNEMLDTATQANIVNAMKSSDSVTSGKGLAQAALMSGMYTAYVNSSAYTGTDKTVTTDKVIDALEDPDFKAFLDSDQGQADLDGYLGSLSMINSSTQDPNAVSELMINGFSDPNLIALLNQSTK